MLFGLPRPSIEVVMEQALGVHRLHFAFTISFHYIFQIETKHEIFELIKIFDSNSIYVNNRSKKLL